MIVNQLLDSTRWSVQNDIEKNYFVIYIDKDTLCDEIDMNHDEVVGLMLQIDVKEQEHE